MGLFSKLYYLFAPYVDHRERIVGTFFAGLTEHSAAPSTRARLHELLQSNIAVINLWTEYRYKGYNYLKKAKRRELYANLDSIAVDFDQFARAAGGELTRLRVLELLTEYFAPARGVYQYRESSSFGRLLRNPATEPLVGDCNQIVTLYIYVYSRYHDVRDLKVRLLPGHVALHFDGTDIETTNGTFVHYDDRDGAELQPVEEIVSINLLDTTDENFARNEVAPQDFLQASRFAFILSSERDIVRNNLDAAYGKLVSTLMQRHNYAQALKFAKQSKDMELLSVVGNNGAVYHMERHEYSAARRYAEHAVRRAELVKNSYHAEGIHHYQAGRYHDATTAFKRYGDESLVQKCYTALYVGEQKKLGGNLTTANIKQYAGTIRRMYSYAKKTGNKELLKHADGLRKHL